MTIGDKKNEATGLSEYSISVVPMMPAACPHRMEYGSRMGWPRAEPLALGWGRKGGPRFEIGIYCTALLVVVGRLKLKSLPTHAHDMSEQRRSPHVASL